RIVHHEIADGEVSVSGVVSDVQYLGADCRVRAQLDDGTFMVASVPSDGLAGVAIGGPIRLAWPRFAAFPVANSDISKGGDQ
ncbi:MAG TPA: TOBE domain-containing protein, partial [Ilumatobacteraceae bacterium]|nr:TOBE domain-containing protein [Ilumatobacteraceae bacterium]